MTNLFKVEGQTLTPLAIYEAVSDTVNYLTFAFSFDSEWDGLTKSAVFTKGDDEYEVVLTSDAITADDHVNLSAGVWEISVVGDLVVDAVVTRQITTSSYNFNVTQSSATSGGVFPPSVASQVYVNVNQATPQTFVGGIPKLAADRVIENENDMVDAKHVADVVATVTADDFNHNDLANKQGGTTDEFYHVTAAEKTVIEHTSGTNTGDQNASSVPITDAGGYYDATTVEGALQEVQYDLNSFIIRGTNLFNPNAIPIDGGYYGSSGSWQANAAYTTYKIEVPYNVTIKTNITQRYSLAFFNASNVPVAGVGYGAGTWTDTIVVANNSTIKYMAFAVSNYNVTNLVFVVGSSVPSSYVYYDDYLNGVKLQPTSVGLSLLIFGDSITETATVSDDGATYTENTRKNWPLYAKNFLQLGAMWNYAKSGASIKDKPDVLARQKLSVQISTAIANSRPADIIVVSAGVNDGDADLGDYATALGKATLADLDKTLLNEAARWAFWTIRTAYPEALCFYALPIQYQAAEPQLLLRSNMIAMANRYNFIVIDATYESGIVRDFEVAGAQGRDLSDGLHPDTSGQKKMSRLYCSKILNALSGK